MTINQDIISLYEIFKKHPRISTDSRNIVKDSIFFALKGANFDGNTFALKALESGAAYAVVDNADIVGEKIILVSDVLQALQTLALHHRTELGIPILAITGSNGKTTTKELTYRVLSKVFSTAVTKGNLNNHIGVPLTLLAMDSSTQFGIVEMGASAQGEIALLCSIAQPDYGVITNIGASHLEGFGSIEGVRKGKGELYDYLDENFTIALYAAEDDTLSAMVEERKNLVKLGYYFLAEVDDDSPFLTVDYDGDPLTTNLAGDYNRFNISAAVAIGEFFEVPKQDIIDAIEDYEPDNNRSQYTSTEHNTLILDCYNANPSSMGAAIENFKNQSSTRAKAVILGDMLELGHYSDDEHKKIVDMLTPALLDKIYLVGDNFARASAFIEGVESFATREQLATHLKANPLKEHLILIKGSHSIGLEGIVEAL